MTNTLNRSTTFTPAALTAEMLERFRVRAAELDRSNSYCGEDIAELRDIGYLSAAVPVHHGGAGLTLGELAHSQRRLARHAPATALATTMHFYWSGIATELERSGDPSLTWLLDVVADG